MVSIGGRDVATLVWKHDHNPDVEVVPISQGKTTVKGVSAAPNAAPTVGAIRQERGESDDTDNTDSEEEGYDSDVQHDRSMDYNTRILIDPNRLKNDKKETNRPTATNQKPM